ncbi:hypothetical protein [Endozoicomonas elysicola]|uniref:Uncharacterized protein n=1 Tax=Endozoicomonas elysicola TaxID=305900 RepID=A0A081KAT1_9GAMM|nr:hypothetical protein [Endozoicomonas elysicola]KEI71257.1 hypothetical protein GV64_11340 [Endozoicomonas elysicola]
MAMSACQVRDVLQDVCEVVTSTSGIPQLLKELGRTSDGRCVCINNFDDKSAEECNRRLMKELNECMPADGVNIETDISTVSKKLESRVVELTKEWEDINRFIKSAEDLLNTSKQSVVTVGEVGTSRSGSKLFLLSAFPGDARFDEVRSKAGNYLKDRVQSLMPLSTVDESMSLAQVINRLEQKATELNGITLTKEKDYIAQGLIKRLNFSGNPEIKKTLYEFMEARARFSGYQLQHLTRRQFGIAMKQALLELRVRGLGVGDDLSQSKISTNLSQIRDLAQDYSQVLAYDGVMQSYLHSHCPLWSDEKPLYRGGDVQREARRKRRSKKGKGFFKPESENINGEALGKGVYLTGLKSEAVRYASGGMTKLWLKRGVPLLDISTKEKKEVLMKLLGISDQERLNQYIQFQFAGACILYHLPGVEYFTLKDPAVIDKIQTIEASAGEDNKVSSQHLDQNGAINGKPAFFKEVSELPSTPEDTPWKADGFWNDKTGAAESLDVLKYRDRKGKEKYVVKSPLSDEQKPVYWRVNRGAVKEGQFLLEPDAGVIKQKYEDKWQKGYPRSVQEKIDHTINTLYEHVKGIL